MRTLILSLAVWFVLSASLQAQHKRDEQASPSAAQYVDPVESEWEFGMTINITGQAQGMTGYIPIPMDYPEQTVEIVGEDKTPNVGRIRQTSPTKDTTQLMFTINRLNNNETAKAVMRFKIKKQMIAAPTDTTGLQIPKRLPSKLKTFLKPSPYIESNHERIEAIAEQLTDDTLTDWEQIEKIYNWVRDNIEYEFDVQIHTCLEALDSKKGDCEELSSVFIAICRAKGIPARAVWIPGHTYPEFYLEDENADGHWFPCQAAGTYEFGSMTEARPILQKGDRFRAPNSSAYVRYVQPTFAARNMQGSVDIQWISRDTSESSSPDPLPNLLDPDK